MKNKFDLFKNYLKVTYQVAIICSNFLDIILAKILNKYIYSLDLRNGLKIINDGKIGKADLSMFSETWYYHNYNPKGFELKSSYIVFDIGANNGYYTLFASVKAKKVYAFEPLEKLFNKIEKTLKYNNIQNVVLENLGVSDKKEVIAFYESKLHDGCHSLYRRDKSDIEIKIQTINLEEYCRENNISKIDLLKLDCEGAEYKIFESLSDSFLKNTLGKVSMECHDDIVSGKTHILIADLLKRNNFEVKIIKGFLYAVNYNQK